MTISSASWAKYIADLRKLNDTAAGLMAKKIADVDFSAISPELRQEILDYAYALATKYGEGSAELACEMYDILAELSGMYLPAAEPAATATYAEVAKAVNGTMKYGDIEMIANAVGRLVKMAGVDTTMQNAIRDGAEWAWIPVGDTCAFCIALAANGWERASESRLKGNHAEHIHAHCDCTYAVRFNSDTKYDSYNPDDYLEIYDNADDSSAGYSATGYQSQSTAQINGIRRAQYAKNKDAINAQKRAAYAKRKEREASQK